MNTLTTSNMGVKTRAATLQEKRNVDEKEGDVDEKEGCQTKACKEIEFYRSLEASRFGNMCVFGKFPMKNKVAGLIKVLKGKKSIKSKVEKGKWRGEAGNDCGEKWDDFTLRAVRRKFYIMENQVIGGKKQTKLLPYILYEDLYDTFCKWEDECIGMRQYYEKSTMYGNVSKDMIQWYVKEFTNEKRERMYKDESKTTTYVKKKTYEERISSDFINFLDTYTATVKLNKPTV